MHVRIKGLNRLAEQLLELSRPDLRWAVSSTEPVRVSSGTK